MENKRSSLLRNTISRRKHRSMATVGIVVFALAIIGAVTIVSIGLNLTGQIMDNSAQKRRLEHFIQPVIMFDPIAFDSIENADPLMLLRSSVWGLLLSKDQEQLNEYRDDYGSVILSKSDVDMYGTQLFGPDVELQHRSFGSDYEQNYYNYDEETERYTIQINAEMAVYTPRILSITHKGDLYTLMVGYIPPGNLWRTDAEGNVYEPDPDKVMVVELTKVKGSYNITALKDTPEELPPQQSSTPATPQSRPEDMSSSVPAVSEEESSSAQETDEPEESSSAPEEEETVPPQFTRVTASSSAEEDSNGSYDPENAMDGDLDTAWIEGAEDDGIEEWLEFQADEPQTLGGITLTNGYTASERLYEVNNRITRIRIEFEDGSSQEETLDLTYDTMATITFDEPVVTSTVRIVILEVESGSRFTDSCISEVEFF